MPSISHHNGINTACGVDRLYCRRLVVEDLLDSRWLQHAQTMKRYIEQEPGRHNSKEMNPVTVLSEILPETRPPLGQ